MSVVNALQQNNLANTHITIDLEDEPSDADLAQALEQNPIVTKIDLNLKGVQQANWNALLRVIATRANLETVKLKDAGAAEERHRAPAGLVCSILQAIQQNTSIRTVRMWVIRLPADISMFLDKASSITSFSLYDCDMDPAERGQGASDLAAALQRNKTIECLELRELEDIYSVPILEGLQLNNSLKTLIFHPASASTDIIANATSHALQRFLESTTSIQRFEIYWEIFSHERLFRPIAQGITNSESVSELKFHSCVFDDRNSFAQLQSILQNKRNLSSLGLHGCYFGDRQIYGDFISLLSRPDSPLRCLEFQNNPSLEGVFPGVQFRNLLQAIKQSKLERFQIGTIRTLQQLQTLTESIPSIRIRELEVDFWDGEDRDDEEPEFVLETVRQDLLNAVKNNFSLQSVKARTLLNSWDTESDLFDTVDEKQRLTFYVNRNEQLDQWANNPETVKQRKVWPDALNLAQRAGPDALFGGLRLVLQSDYVKLSGNRKRKRPQSYTPA